jgi:hypothetical protein
MLLLQVEEEDAESGRFSIDHVVRMCTHYSLAGIAVATVIATAATAASGTAAAATDTAAIALCLLANDDSITPSLHCEQSASRALVTYSMSVEHELLVVHYC